jgi:hypothetical protein
MAIFGANNQVGDAVFIPIIDRNLLYAAPPALSAARVIDISFSCVSAKSKGVATRLSVVAVERSF